MVLATEKADPEKPQPTKHIRNILTILAYSNATPIRGHWGRGYGCCFCDEQFAKPDDLKSHTLNTHDDAKQQFMEGKSAYEFSVKLDITGLICSVCLKEMNTLENLMKHIKVTHNGSIFTDIRHQILPFKFEEGLHCAMCPKEFGNFKSLSEHMNEHYRNFECDVCDRGFVNKSALKMHKFRHEIKDWSCVYCSKVFSSRVKVRSHERAVHIFNSKTYTCGYCEDMFTDTTAKSKHQHSVHGVEPTLYKCKACDATFSRQISLTKHIKNKHLMFRPYKCRVCSRAYVDNKGLKKHMVTHSNLKEYQCHVCSKRFHRKNTLCAHLKLHDKLKKD